MGDDDAYAPSDVNTEDAAPMLQEPGCQWKDLRCTIYALFHLSASLLARRSWGGGGIHVA